MIISDSIKYIGVNDKKIRMFEGQYPVPDGMTYNSYVILDEKIAVMDTVEADFAEEWQEKIQKILEGRIPDYLIVQHMEPDHSSNIRFFMTRYPNAKIVASEKAFTMIRNFFGTDYSGQSIVVGDKDTLCLGEHTLTFYTAPMVHWPEVIVTYDSYDKVLFSADGFGCFGNPGNINEWIPRGRRYYMGIVAKYGAQVQALLKKLQGLDIQKICSLHGAILDRSIGTCLNLYDTWSSYRPEEEGVVIAYTSIYGNTKKAVEILSERLRAEGEDNIVVYNLAQCDISLAMTDAFRYSKLILATPTYNGEVFPYMKNFIDHLVERNYQNRKVAFIENGSWAPAAVKTMKSMLEKSKNLIYAENIVKIMSSVKEENIQQIENLAREMRLSPQL